MSFTQQGYTMAIDCFIKFDGVAGESADKDHKGEIDVVSWNWSATNTLPPTSGGMGAGKSVPGPFSFQHQYDKASPLLGKYAASGKFFKQVYLTARKAGEGQKDFLKVTMKEVLVTSVLVDASGDGGVHESVSLAYRDIDFAYKPQDPKGALGTAVKFGWDTAKNIVR
jgi:type VI secretion system secreted protein Hcp